MHLFVRIPLIIFTISISSSVFPHEGNIHKLVGKSKADSLEACVEPTEIMRKKHFEFLYHQRDLTVLDGIRTKNHSLANCIDCHVSYDNNAKPIPINSEGQFCYVCHIETATNIDCFSCHATVPRYNETKSQNENELQKVLRMNKEIEFLINTKLK